MGIAIMTAEALVTQCSCAMLSRHGPDHAIYEFLCFVARSANSLPEQMQPPRQRVVRPELVVAIVADLLCQGAQAASLPALLLAIELEIPGVVEHLVDAVGATRLPMAIVTPLVTLAAQMGQVAALSGLLGLPDARNDTVRASALEAAAQAGHAPAVLTVLRVFDDPARASDTRALSVAAYTGRDEVVRCLLKWGCSLAARGLALRWAAEAGHIQCTRQLLSAGVEQQARIEAVKAAARAGHALVVRILVEAGVPVDALDVALMHAVMNGHALSIRPLLEVGVSKDARDAALLHAVMDQHVAIIRSLLEAGVTAQAVGVAKMALAEEPATERLPAVLSLLDAAVY